MRDDEKEVGAALSTWRSVVVHLVIAFVVVGSLACIVFDTEAWPLSNYPMYTDLYSGKYSAVRLYGVGAAGEVAVVRHSALAPLGVLRPAAALKKALDASDWERRVGKIAAGLARLYESRRRAGLHRGPAFTALRVYEETWSIRSGAVNRDSPESRRLLAEAPIRGSR